MTSQSRPFITSRIAALIAALATGVVAFQSIREAIFNPGKRPGWLLSPFRSLPFWVTVVANVVFYLFALWMLASLFRETRGRERVVVAGWLLGWILLLVERFSPAVSIIRYIDATTWGIAFLAALAIFLEFYAPRDARSETGADDH